MRIQEFSYSVDLLQALLWQYNNATSLQELLNAKQEWYNLYQSEFWEDWYTNVFNLQTANNFGCSVWSIILGLPLHINDNPDLPHPTFGFGPESNGYMNFENGNFTDVDSTFDLTLEEKRLLLKLRYFQLVSRGAIPEINQFLKFAFEGFPGTSYILDTLKMEIKFVCTFEMSLRLRYLIKLYDLIPRGAGVGIKYLTNITALWGFGPEGNGYNNFNNGNFILDDEI